MRHAWEARINTCPRRSARSPNAHRGFDVNRIVERSRTHKNQVRPRFRFAEHLRAASRTESTMHDIAAVRNASIIR